MTPLQKAAIFLVIIGVENGKRILALMDNSEINAVVPEIRKLTTLSQDMQEQIMADFHELGYEKSMHPTDLLTLIRFLFKDGKITR